MTGAAHAVARPARVREAAPGARFLVDAMLGDVARDLRLLGYDAELAREESDSTLLRRAQAESRVLLTRDRHLVARARDLRCVQVPDSHLGPLVADILSKLGLRPAPTAFMSRCLACNSQLEAVSPADEAALVPDHVALTSRRIRFCRGCRRSYWPGTHMTRLNARILEILGALHSEVA